MSNDVNQLLGVVPQRGHSGAKASGSAGAADPAFTFFRSRYRDAYAVASLLRTLRVFVAISTVLGVVACVVLSAEGGIGSELFLGIAMVGVVNGVLVFFILGALVALVRVFVDMAVSAAPSLSDEERLRLMGFVRSNAPDTDDTSDQDTDHQGARRNPAPA